MNTDNTNKFNGRFGKYGGQYIAETLMPAMSEIETAFNTARNNREFQKDLTFYLKEFVGRPSPLFYAERLTEQLQGAKIYLKREDLNHTGAHKINNTMGQALLAQRMKKSRLIAETGAGQHGVATATAAAIFGFSCDVYMGEEDMKRQEENVKRMYMLGAKVIPVHSGTKTLKDAMNEAMREWIATSDDTFYVIGSAAGPHPYPIIVREFQKIIGEETKQQILEKENRLPDTVIACVGGGSNAIGIFTPFIPTDSVKLIGVEAAGFGLNTSQHAASISGGKVGILHGSKTYLLQTEDGQICNAHSISAGLDYPGVGPEHSWLHDKHRVQYVSVTDEEAVNAFLELTRIQGIIPALESSHAVAHTIKAAPSLPNNHIIVVNVSGRGDKDMQSVNQYLSEK